MLVKLNADYRSKEFYDIILGSARNLPGNSSPEPPPPPPRNHDPNSSGTTANDSKESNEMSEAECDMALNRASYGGKILALICILFLEFPSMKILNQFEL